jgi:hypothetical protein
MGSVPNGTKITQRFGLGSTLRPRGRPKKRKEDEKK